MIGLWTWLWQGRSSVPMNPSPYESPGPAVPPIGPSPTLQPIGGKRWCLPKSGVDQDALQRNIDYVCGLGLDCGPIQEGGMCFDPNTVRAHAAYAMNLYYQVMGSYEYDCDFEHSGALTNVDPSKSHIYSFFFFFFLIYLNLIFFFINLY